jgi:hypothetical protein
MRGGCDWPESDDHQPPDLGLAVEGHETSDSTVGWPWCLTAEIGRDESSRPPCSAVVFKGEWRITGHVCTEWAKVAAGVERAA